MDILKQEVVRMVKEQVKALDGARLVGGATFKVMSDIENLSIQATVKTPSGPRFFMVTIQEKY